MIAFGLPIKTLKQIITIFSVIDFIVTLAVGILVMIYLKVYWMPIASWVSVVFGPINRLKLQDAGFESICSLIVETTIFTTAIYFDWLVDR